MPDWLFDGTAARYSALAWTVLSPLLVLKAAVRMGTVGTQFTIMKQQFPGHLPDDLLSRRATLHFGFGFLLWWILIWGYGLFPFAVVTGKLIVLPVTSLVGWSPGLYNPTWIELGEYFQQQAFTIGFFALFVHLISSMMVPAVMADNDRGDDQFWGSLKIMIAVLFVYLDPRTNKGGYIHIPGQSDDDDQIHVEINVPGRGLDMLTIMQCYDDAMKWATLGVYGLRPIEYFWKVASLVLLMIAPIGAVVVLRTLYNLVWFDEDDGTQIVFVPDTE